MNTKSNSDVALLPPLAGSPVPRSIYVSQEEWDSINDVQRQFLIDAAEVSMAHLIENGDVIAWGPGLAQFTHDSGRSHQASHIHIVTAGVHHTDIASLPIAGANLTGVRQAGLLGDG